MQLSMDAGSALGGEDRRLASDTFENFTYEEESQLESLIDDYHAHHDKSRRK
jgi:hypothetical protein